MLQGTLDGLPIIINAEMRKDSYKTENAMNQWVKAINRKQSDIVNQSFYTRFFAKYGDAFAVIDFVNSTIMVSEHGTIKLVEAPAEGGCSELKMYSNEPKTSYVYDLQIGKLTMRVKFFPNRQLRNEVTLLGANHVQNANGYVISPMSTKQCRVKKIGTSKHITMNGSGFKRNVKEMYIQTKNNELVSQKTMKIPCV